MKKSYKIILIIISVIVAAGIIWFFLFRKKTPTLVLPAEKPRYGYIAQIVTATGTIQPVDTVSVGTQISGTIKILNADFNSRVHKGQLLAQIDKSLLQAVVDQNRAALQNQRSQLDYNQLNFDRQKLLYATGSISKADYDLAQNNYKIAVAGVTNAEALLRSSLKNLSFADIYSPIDGVVLSRNINVGQTVAANFNTPTLFIIAKDITKMQVEAAVDEADIGNIRKGQHVSFTVDAYIDDQFDGTISDVRLHPKVASSVVTYTTIIAASNDQMKLKPGMTANINAYTKEVEHALLISSKALNFSPDSSLSKDYKIQPIVETVSANTSKPIRSASEIIGRKGYVWIKRGDVLVQRAVVTGLDDNTHVQILQGLTPSDDVVTSLPIPPDAIKSSSNSLIPKAPASNSKK